MINEPSEIKFGRFVIPGSRYKEKKTTVIVSSEQNLCSISLNEDRGCQGRAATSGTSNPRGETLIFLHTLLFARKTAMSQVTS